MTKVLEDFLLLHILTKIEKERLILDVHHTSMIHNATTVQDHYDTLVTLADMRSRLEFESHADPANIRKKLISAAEKYYQIYPDLKVMKARVNSISEPDLIEKISEIEFIELNRRDDVLDDPDVEFEITDEFDQEIEYPSAELKSYIVTGGARIARGLTLQGLTITCFTRRAEEPNFDTMLQMARWCGYRIGYDKLVRILTTTQIVEDYQSIFEAEAHMRMQIERLTDDSDPVEDIIWIKDQNGLNISGRLPTKQFRQHISGKNGFVAEYTWTHFPPELAKGVNGAFLSAFLRLFLTLKTSSSWKKPPNGKSGYVVAHDVTYVNVKRFVDAYCSNYPSTPAFFEQRDTLISAIEVLKKHLKWNVALAQPTKEPKKTFTHLKDQFNLSKRTPDGGKIKQVYSSFEVASEIDLVKGAERTQPLLLLYLADHELKYSDGSNCYDRATHPIVLFGIICPVPYGDIEKYIGGHRENVTVKPWWMK
jgi:hypothetical protein